MTIKSDENTVAIIDYGVGNLGSLMNLLNFIGIRGVLASSPKELSSFKKLILPGVGHFSNAMENLKKKDFVSAIQDANARDATIVGVCLGMQLLTSFSEEGNEEGLGLIQGTTKKFPGLDELGKPYPVPHMGWAHVDVSEVQGKTNYFLPQSRFYFVHSYFVEGVANESVLSTSSYCGQKFISSVIKGNILGFQFHPEKSHKYGIHLIKTVLG